jgi:hypothetical protein
MMTGAISRTRSLNQELVASTIFWSGLSRRLQGSFLEIVQLMRCAIFEGKIGNETVADILLLFADDLAKFQRQRCRNRNRTRDRLVVVDDLGRARMGQNPSDDIAGVVGSHAANDGVEVARLPSERDLSEIFQIKPHRDRQRGQQQGDQKACERRGAHVSGRFAFHGSSSNSAGTFAMLSPGVTHVKLTWIAAALQLYAVSYVVKKHCYEYAGEATVQRNVVLYLTTLLVLIPIDFLFLGLVAKGFFTAQSATCWGRSGLRPPFCSICFTWWGF